MSSAGRYEIRIKASAEEEMNSLPRTVFPRVARAILRLESSPRPRGSIKLHGREEYRIRVGAYRILYVVDDAGRTVEIVAIRHRKDVYRPGS